jgi:tRNA-specific 2-thiouridylase
MRAMVAMSGGVDSSVAAAQMVAEGHEVIGVTLKLWEGPKGELPTAGCCTVSDAEDARRVAAQLGIPYYVLDYTEPFMDGVVGRFIADYASGRTPNPCVECNRTVKFDRMLSHALELDCDVLVTGHYARVRRDGSGWHLHRGVDATKDQSYVLSMLDQEALARTRFPVGELTKDETRAIAGELRLRTANKPDSQDICFVGDDDYRGFVRRHAPEAARAGKVVDVDGREVGTHDGVTDFTIGQRRGLGVAVGEPRFVVGIDAGSATITIGRRADLDVVGAVLSNVSFVAGTAPGDRRVDAQVRYKGGTVPARLEGEGTMWRLVFEQPVAGVAPGQTAVFYRGDEVLGGGIIERSLQDSRIG